MDEARARRWLPAGHPVVRRRYRAGKLAVELFQPADPSALADALNPADFAEDERFPYWAEVWPSALALARFCAAAPLEAGVGTVELGCGTGLAGTAAALRGAHVLFTDYEPEALAFARANHALNLGRPGRCRLFDWREPPRGITAGLVLASDVLYEKRFLAPFLATLRRILRPGGSAWVAEPGRKIAEGTVESLEEAGFARALHLMEVEWNGRVHNVWIHRLTRPAGRLGAPGPRPPRTWRKG